MAINIHKVRMNANYVQIAQPIEMTNLFPQVVAFPDQEVQIPRRADSRQYIQPIQQPYQMAHQMQSAFQNQSFLNYAYIPQPQPQFIGKPFETALAQPNIFQIPQNQLPGQAIPLIVMQAAPPSKPAEVLEKDLSDERLKSRLSFDFYRNGEKPFEKRNSLLEQLNGGKVDEAGDSQPPVVVINSIKPQKRNIGKLTIEERRIKVQRFREKRSQRCWKKTIEYQCRKIVADRRPRVRGRFVSKQEATLLLKKEGSNQLFFYGVKASDLELPYPLTFPPRVAKPVFKIVKKKK